MRPIEIRRRNKLELEVSLPQMQRVSNADKWRILPISFCVKLIRILLISIDKFERIERATRALFDDTKDLKNNDLFSQAYAKLLKIVSLLEANKDMLMKNHAHFYRSTNVYAYEKIAYLEVRRRNFQAVIPIHEFCDSIGDSFGYMTDQLYVLYSLALMVTGKKDSYQASEAALKIAQHVYSNTPDPNKPQLHPDEVDFASLKSYRDSMADLGVYWNCFLVELRRKKKWDEALDLTNKFGMYIEESKYCSSSFLYAVTYLERYRVEARKRPKGKRNWMSVSLYKHIHSKINERCQQERKGEVLVQPYMPLLLAQWTYLHHHGSTEQSLTDTAIDLVGKYITSQQVELSAMMRCIECRQKSTTSDPLLICSGCRAVCYCCIDHQRSSWKKELDTGVGIGHKLLCPLYKALRKAKFAYEGNKDNRDEYVARFRNECESFLSDSLGLRDLCFPQEFVDEYV